MTGDADHRRYAERMRKATTDAQEAIMLKEHGVVRGVPQFPLPVKEPAKPMSTPARRLNYIKQNGCKRLTPAQRRRLDKKKRHNRRHPRGTKA